MNAHTEAQFTAIHAAEAQCNTTLAALRERTASSGDDAYDATREAEYAGAAEAYAQRDAIVAANGGPIDPIAYLLAIGREL